MFSISNMPRAVWEVRRGGGGPNKYSEKGALSSVEEAGGSSFGTLLLLQKQRTQSFPQYRAIASTLFFINDIIIIITFVSCPTGQYACRAHAMIPTLLYNTI